MKNFFIYSLKFIIIKLSSKKFHLQSKNFLFEKYNINHSIFIKIFSKLKQRKYFKFQILLFYQMKTVYLLKIYNF